MILPKNSERHFKKLQTQAMSIFDEMRYCCRTVVGATAIDLNTGQQKQFGHAPMEESTRLSDNIARGLMVSIPTSFCEYRPSEPVPWTPIRSPPLPNTFTSDTGTKYIRAWFNALLRKS